MALTRITNVVESIDTTSTNDPAANTNPSGGVGHTWLNKTSGEMYICTDATAGANVWTNVGTGTGDIAPFNGIVATGGTITTDGDYKVHVFTTSGTFAVSNVGTANDEKQVEYLVVAGGGGSGNATNNCGGGGAGGYRNSYNNESSGGGGASESALAVTAQTYTVTIGAGGAGHPHGANGTDSTFSSITCVGGGKGGIYNTAPDAGGSGGGSGLGTGAAGTANQGYAGGNSANGGQNSKGGGGGGGASAVGGTGSNSVGGNGGNGLASSITGSSVTRAGGGGGGRFDGSPGTGGSGGGGNGQSNGVADAGVVNTGGGGGGAGMGTPGAGGSGIVIIRYKFQQSLGDIKWLYQKSQQIW